MKNVVAQEIDKRVLDIIDLSKRAEERNKYDAIL